MSTAIDNRNEVYYKIMEKLPEKRKLIFELLQQNEPCSAQYIHENYLIPINEVSGRVTELKNLFLIKESGKEENRWTGHKNTVYLAVKDNDERIDLINARYVELRTQKDQLINDSNLGMSEFTLDILKHHINRINKQIKSLEKILEYGAE